MANEVSFWKEIEDLIAPRTRTRFIKLPPPPGEKEVGYGSWININEEVPGANLEDPETFKKIVYAAMKAGVKPKDALTIIMAIQEKKRKIDAFKGSKAYQQAEMVIRPIVEKYGLQWDDSKYYWQNYNDARKSLNPETRRQFDQEAQAAMLRASEKPETRQSIEAGILKKYVNNQPLTEREQEILDTFMGNKHFNAALKAVQENVETRYLPLEEQIARAEELATKLRQRKPAVAQGERAVEGTSLTGSPFDYLIGRGGSADRFGRRQEGGRLPEGATLIPNAKTKDGRSVYRLPDGRLIAPK